MVHIKPALSSLLILLFLFSPITTASAAAFSFPFPFPDSYSQYKTFISLSPNLFSRVSNKGVACGDIAKLIAQSLERGLYVYDAVSELKPLTFISLTPSLFSSVSNLLAERGDIAGANRTTLFARSLERGLYVYDAVWELKPLTFISLTPSLFSSVSNLLAERGDIAGANRTKLFARSLERGLYVYDAVSELNPLTFISLTPSLILRVSNLRAERGDIAGANRAKLFARSLERVLYVYGAVPKPNQLLGFLSDFGWAGSEIENFERTTWVARNYRNVLKVAPSVSELNQLLGFLSDFGRAGSEIEKIERTTWVARNYRNVLKVATSVSERTIWVPRNYRNVLKDVLKKVVETVQTEVREGDLLRDCLEVGSADLQGLVQIIKDVASQYCPTFF